MNPNLSLRGRHGLFSDSSTAGPFVVNSPFGEAFGSSVFVAQKAAKRRVSEKAVERDGRDEEVDWWRSAGQGGVDRAEEAGAAAAGRSKLFSFSRAGEQRIGRPQAANARLRKSHLWTGGGGGSTS